MSLVRRVPALTTEEAAAFLGVDVRVLESWRRRKTGPPWREYPSGRGTRPVVRYRLDELLAYDAACARGPQVTVTEGART